MGVVSGELLSNLSINQTLSLFTLLQHWGFAFLQGGQWVQEGLALVPGPSKAREVI